MTRISHHHPVLLLVLALGLTATAVGQTTVYKVIDPDGKVTYTDTPPGTDDETVVETLDLTISSPSRPADSQALVDQLAATADRLKQDRLDRESARRQQRQAELPPEPAYPAPGSEPRYPDAGYGPYPFYYPGIHRPGYWHRDKDRNRDHRLENSTNWHVPLRAPRLGIDPLRERRQQEQRD